MDMSARRQRVLKHVVEEYVGTAVPVASETGIDNVKDIADDLVVVHRPDYFGAVSRFYRSFAQVEDEEVAQLLAAGSP